MDLIIPDSAGLARAADLVRGGEIIAFPTDTVYGLAAAAADPVAMRRVYEVKSRPASQPLVLMVAEAVQVEEWAHVEERERRYMDLFWPGPLTLVLRAHRRLRPPLVSSARTVAVRIPDHPVALDLLWELSEGLATTSANRSGEEPAMTAREAVELSGVAAALDGGRAPGGRASTVLDLSGPVARILRDGPLTAAELGLDTRGGEAG